MKVYSLINQKGGVAKTTSTYNISRKLAEKGNRVLMVDMDSLCRIRHNGSYTEKMVIPRFLIPI